MPSDRVAATKKAVGDMLLYYHQALVEVGCSDPKQEIATELAKMIRLSDEQAEFLVNNSQTMPVSEIIKNIDILLTKMEVDNKVDKQSMVLIKQGLLSLHTMIKE